MKQKPFAYYIEPDTELGGELIFPTELNEIDNFYKLEGWKYKSIPLYTSIKELSDEEIGLMTTDPRWEHIESPLLWEFAKEILKKASEK